MKCVQLATVRLGDWACLDRGLELITTITRVTRIPVPALLIVSVVDFSLDSARFDLVVISAALAIFLSGGLRAS